MTFHAATASRPCIRGSAEAYLPSVRAIHARRVPNGFKFGRWVDSVLMQRALGPGVGGPPR